MKYSNMVKGTFLERPNRFIAYVDVDGQIEKVHVKNTGRCKELLVPGATVYLQEILHENRSTKYDLITVEKNGRFINMDSNAPNIVVQEWLKAGKLYENLTQIRPETVYGNSRFDFFAQTDEKKILIEVKGVTLERDGYVQFPDAPSDRAVKHLEELTEAVKDGYECYVIFVIQMQGVKDFAPNELTHPAFAKALQKADAAGVHILAMDCVVTIDSLLINEAVPVRLSVLEQSIAPLISWYQSGHRDLPWRNDPSPYHVWLSEIMLQQTRVEAVKGYYKRFLEALPDISSLADAKEDLLLKLWEGLGYYNRVRNLKKAAQIIVDQYGGAMPGSYKELLSLPGIGSYTAGAIGSICFGLPYPAVDGNVLRVLSRLRMDADNIADGKVKKRIENELSIIMPKNAPGDYNQALMELGATVCVPNGAPHCEICPWNALCHAHLMGKEMEYPVKSAKNARTVEELTVLIIQDEDKMALHKRADRGLLAGLYELPNMAGHQDEKRVISYLKELGLEVLQIRKLISAKHIFTHKEWHMIGYLIRVDELSDKLPEKEAKEYIFADLDSVREQYAIPSAFSAYTRYFLKDEVKKKE